MSENKTRVMIADDEIHIRTMMKGVIKMMGFEVAGEASNGKEAVDIYKKEKPDIVLLDINMPLKNGIDALNDIIDMNPDAFVIMLTSVSDMESVNESISSGATHYIRKDTPLQQIKTIISETWDSFNKGDL